MTIDQPFHGKRPFLYFWDFRSKKIHCVVSVLLFITTSQSDFPPECPQAVLRLHDGHWSRAWLVIPVLGLVWTVVMSYQDMADMVGTRWWESGGRDSGIGEDITHNYPDKWCVSLGNLVHAGGVVYTQCKVGNSRAIQMFPGFIICLFVISTSSESICSY